MVCSIWGVSLQDLTVIFQQANIIKLKTYIVLGLEKSYTIGVSLKRNHEGEVLCSVKAVDITYRSPETWLDVLYNPLPSSHLETDLDQNVASLQLQGETMATPKKYIRLFIRTHYQHQLNLHSSDPHSTN